MPFKYLKQDVSVQDTGEQTWSAWEKKKTHWAAVRPSCYSQLAGDSTYAIALLCTATSPCFPGQVSYYHLEEGN